MSLIIHAPNVHQGGGKALLLSLLHAARKQGSVRAILDERLTLPDGLIDGITEIRVRPSLLGRLAGEWTLRSLAKETDTVLCFGNLPPLFKAKGRVVVFLQNRYLIDKVSLEGFSFVARMRILIERVWLGRCVKHADKVLVQTPSMQQAAQSTLRRSVDVVSFCAYHCGYHRSGVGKNRLQATTYDFLYVATGEPHKNHVNLIEAWKLLAAERLYPSLCLTVLDRQYARLAKIIDQARTEHGLRIYNVNAHSWPEIERLYEESGALVYPSTLESFGLPLIEARRAGLSIIAAELDYVRDMVDPEQSFDPRSPLSIARAIKRYLNAPEPPLTLVTSESFVEQLLFV